MTGSWVHNVLDSQDARSATRTPAPVHVDDVKTPKTPASRRVGASEDKGAFCTDYTCVNFTPVALMRSRACLMSSETMRAMSQPSVRKTLASPTFPGAMRMSSTA